jgi:hypothetical protein
MENAMASEKPNSWFNRGDAAHNARLKQRKQAEVESARRVGFDKWLERHLVHSNRADWKLIRRVQCLIQGRAPHSHSAFPMIDGVDELIRYERLEEDFNRILSKVGVREFVSIPHENATPGKKPFQEYYTPELRRLMEKYIGDQLLQFGYSWEEAEATAHGR